MARKALRWSAIAPRLDVTIEVDASDSDGTVSKVEFFEGENKLGEATTSPYRFTWTSVLLSMRPRCDAR